MLSQYLQELEQNPFNAEEFVERLAWRSTSGSGANKSASSGSFQPELLEMTFTQAIKDLEVLGERMERKCQKLEEAVGEEERQHWRNVARLLDANLVAFSQFQQLDGQMNRVAARVVHLGDQLEAVNTPRARAAEAYTLMMHFAHYLTPPASPSEGEDDVAVRGLKDMGGTDSPVLGETPQQISESADVIQKLYLISQELPAGMCSRTLCHCVQVVMRDVFADIVPLCRRAQDLIQKVFAAPDEVMTKFVINIYQGQLKEFIQSRLSPGGTVASYGEAYFTSLYDLYTKTQALSQQLHSFSLDQTLLPQLTKAIFQAHLQTYISCELRFLKERFAAISQRFYLTRGHKKMQPSSGMKEMRMHLQDVLGGHGAPEELQGETLLAEEVALSMLHDTKTALLRCATLSSSNALASNAVQIYNVLTSALINDYVCYAIDVGVEGIPTGDVKSPPHLTFLTVVQQTSSVLHLLHKLLHDSLLPLVISSAEHSGVLQRKRQMVERVQQRLSAGLEKLITAICQHVRYLLHQLQRRTDFKPEHDNLSVAGCTGACVAVVRWLTTATQEVERCLDGNNLELFRLELGTRLHRTILDHLLRQEYNTAGAMCVICDVNEYRKVVQAWRLPLLTSLFDTLHTLCKLLQVSPQNLQLVCSGDQLAGLDRTVLANFIQLRADYKTAKLGAHFK
ncbi:exocyst complex component 5 [Hyalella azteca]|uniref:Exocyst complex component 5 n=1 Tax=Hyalella azteca TaxID=294128 RepID=A0A979FQ42_HYAAZ|nr:exocyst complex component 5 [Hyalella azteca]